MKRFLVPLITAFLGLSLMFGYFYNMNRSLPEQPQPETPKVASLSAEPESSLPSPTPLTEKYPLHTRIKATLFWVGEKATQDNDYIPNHASAWDSQWLDHFGGIDNPYNRNGYLPKNFTPKENPFYVALPYNDLEGNGQRKNKPLPWINPQLSEGQSQLKNRWVKVIYKKEVCYAQWEDVGPFENDDYDYVFNAQVPKEDRAGLDLSPAARHCLKMATNDLVNWQFVDGADVPEGPWREIITTSLTNWN